MSGKPDNNQELRRLKQAKKEAKKAQNKTNQTPQLPPPKTLERPFKDLSVEGDHVRIMSFNVLAQSLIKRELFPDSGDVLKWKCRKKMIAEEIEMYNADIMCLQELDNFDSFFQDILSKLGYDTVYLHHPAKKHGCAIAYKKDRLDQVKYKTVDYNTDTLCSPSIMTGNVAQVVALEYKERPGIGFVVGNTHLYWRPSCNYERFRQSAIFVKHLLDLKSELPNNIRWKPLLMGDFNTTPDDPVYGILVDNKLSTSQVEDLNRSLEFTLSNKGQAEDEEEMMKEIDTDAITAVNDLVALFQDNNQKTWQSVYSLVGQLQEPSGLFGEPEFTNYTAAFKGVLDYMFVEKDTRIKRLLLMPKEESLKPTLPNKNFGSDHLCLVADLLLE